MRKINFKEIRLIEKPMLQSLTNRKLGLELTLLYLATVQNKGSTVYLKVIVTQYPLGKIRHVDIYNLHTGQAYNAVDLPEELKMIFQIPPQNIEEYCFSFAKENRLIRSAKKYANEEFKVYQKIFSGLGKNQQMKIFNKVTVVCAVQETSKFAKIYRGKSGEYVATLLTNELPKYPELSQKIYALGKIPTKKSSGIKSEHNFCKNPVGNCAEVSAAIKAMEVTNCTLGAIEFGPPIRPRTLQYIESCENCTSIFPNL